LPPWIHYGLSDRTPKADLASAADHLRWDTARKEWHLADIVEKLIEAKDLASTEQFAALNLAIELLTAKGSDSPTLQGRG
jgi:hypothetical protein